VYRERALASKDEQEVAKKRYRERIAELQVSQSVSQSVRPSSVHAA
jgi:hypothetical protein